MSTYLDVIQDYSTVYLKKVKNSKNHELFPSFIYNNSNYLDDVEIPTYSVLYKKRTNKFKVYSIGDKNLQMDTYFITFIQEESKELVELEMFELDFKECYKEWSKNNDVEFSFIIMGEYVQVLTSDSKQFKKYLNHSESKLSLIENLEKNPIESNSIWYYIDPTQQKHDLDYLLVYELIYLGKGNIPLYNDRTQKMEFNLYEDNLFLPIKCYKVYKNSFENKSYLLDNHTIIEKLKSSSNYSEMNLIKIKEHFEKLKLKSKQYNTVQEVRDIFNDWENMTEIITFTNENFKREYLKINCIPKNETLPKEETKTLIEFLKNLFVELDYQELLTFSTTISDEIRPTFLTLVKRMYFVPIALYSYLMNDTFSEISNSLTFENYIEYLYLHLNS